MIDKETFEQLEAAFLDKQVCMGFNRYVITGTVHSIDRGYFNLINATIVDNEAPSGSPVFNTKLVRVQQHSCFIALVDE